MIRKIVENNLLQLGLRFPSDQADIWKKIRLCRAARANNIANPNFSCLVETIFQMRKEGKYRVQLAYKKVIYTKVRAFLDDATLCTLLAKIINISAETGYLLEIWKR